MKIELLYHKNIHLLKFLLYIVMSGIIFLCLGFIIENIYFNLFLILPGIIYGLYHLFEWKRLSNVFQIEIESEKIGLTVKNSTEWLDKKIIQNTFLFYSTVDKPKSCVTLCLALKDGRTVRIPGFPEIDKWISEIY
ncbi:MAG: hypothetical protein COA79_19415 [Planctomycetota bacterium]|nr:MAG: hypothetical protein COA79_19415 [Planctomycetota bacterium]